MANDIVAVSLFSGAGGLDANVILFANPASRAKVLLLLPCKQGNRYTFALLLVGVPPQAPFSPEQVLWLCA